jgi:hypothetical protein
LISIDRPPRELPEADPGKEQRKAEQSAINQPDRHVRELGRQSEAKAFLISDRLRTLDVYVKRDGRWIHVASNSSRRPEANAALMEMPRSISPALRKFILDGREEVWRAWFSNDQAKLAMLIPKEAVAINNGEEEWNNQAMIFSSAQRFADSGAKLIRLEFPGTEIQIYGNTVILYTTYVFEVEAEGKRQISMGRGTEIFVMRNNVLVNTGWHLDSGK